MGPYDTWEGRPHAPKGDEWERGAGRSLRHRRRRVRHGGVDLRGRAPTLCDVGHEPQPSVTQLHGTVPSPTQRTRQARGRGPRALAYMALAPGGHDRTIFIGSCTNSRIVAWSGDEGRGRLARCCSRRRSRRSADCVRCRVRVARRRGRSMCLGMNPDILSPRRAEREHQLWNFEGRQGKAGRTHLVSGGRRRHRDRRTLLHPGGPLDGTGPAYRPARRPIRRRHDQIIPAD